MSHTAKRRENPKQKESRTILQKPRTSLNYELKTMKTEERKRSEKREVRNRETTIYFDSTINI